MKNPFDYEEYLYKKKCFNYDSTLSYCFPWGGIKQAALLFDRIYFDSFDYLVWYGIWENAGIYDYNRPSWLDIIRGFERIPHEIIYLNKEFTTAITDAYDFDSRGRPRATEDQFKNAYLKMLPIKAVEKGMKIVPFYGGVDTFIDDNKVGENHAWSLIYDNVSTIDCNSLSWQQILDFRKDKRSTIYYRQLRKLHRKILNAKSNMEAVDLLSEAEEKYELAIKKHGFEIINSIISVVCDKETLIAGLIGGASGNFAMGLLTGGVVAATKISLQIQKCKIDKQLFLISDDAQAALICEIKNLVKHNYD